MLFRVRNGAVTFVQVVIRSVKAIHVSTEESVSSGIRGTSVTVHIRHSVAGTVAEVGVMEVFVSIRRNVADG